MSFTLNPHDLGKFQERYEKKREKDEKMKRMKYLAELKEIDAVHVSTNRIEPHHFTLDAPLIHPLKYESN